MKVVLTKRKKDIIAGLAIFMCLGYLYAWSNFVPHMEADEGWTRTELANVFSTSMIAFSFACVIGGILAKKYGMVATSRLGALMIFIGLFGSGMSENIILLYITYGILFSFGVGVTYVSAMSAVQLWFPEKLGTISGLLLAMYGLGGAIMGTFSVGIIGKSSWETSFKIMGILLGTVILLATRYIKSPDENEVLHLNEIVEKAAGKRKVKSMPDSSEVPVEMTPKEMLKRKSFWMYFLWFSLGASLWLGAVGQATTFALDLGATLAVATFTSGTITFCNGMGRLVTGWLYDHAKRRIIMICLSTALLLASILMLTSMHFKIIWLFIISVGIIGFAYGGTATTNPVFIRRFYGNENYPQNLGIVNFNGIISAGLGSTMGTIIAENFGSYDIMMIYFAVIMLIAMMLQFGIKKP